MCLRLLCMSGTEEEGQEAPLLCISVHTSYIPRVAAESKCGKRLETVIAVSSSSLHIGCFLTTNLSYYYRLQDAARRDPTWSWWRKDPDIEVRRPAASAETMYWVEN